MTELHNMSVAPRSMLTLRREEIRGRRVRVAVGRSAQDQWPDNAALTRLFREDGVACALAMLQVRAPVKTTELREQIAEARRTANPLGTLRRLCDTALADLGLPDGFGFFVGDPDGSRLETVPVVASIAILAARSGPLYVPGRFEPSLISAGAVTLFFPWFEDRGVR